MRTWLEPHETGLRSWDTIKAEFWHTFATTLRKQKAELHLNSCIQHSNDSVMVYAEEMKRLFQRANPTMSEDEEVRHLMKGAKKQLFAGFVRSPPTTVGEFISEATTIEKALDLNALQYQRTTMSMVTASAGEALYVSTKSLRDTIRVIVREEVAKYLPILPCCRSQQFLILSVKKYNTLGVPGPLQLHRCPNP